MNTNRKHKNSRKPKQRRESPSFPLILLSGIFIVIVPLIYSQKIGDPALYPRFTVWAAGLIVIYLIILLQLNKYKIFSGIFRNGIFISLSAFILISGISLFSARNPVEGITDLLKWVMAFLLILAAVVIFLQARDPIPALAKAAVINALIAVLIGLSQLYNYVLQNPADNAQYEVSGLMTHKNQFSISLFLLLPFLILGVRNFKKTWKRFAWIALVADLFLLVMLQTRAVWIALLISLFIVVFALLGIPGERRQKITFLNYRIGGRMVALLVALFIGGAVAGYLVTGENPGHRLLTSFDTRFTSNEWRIEMWESTVDLIGDHPVKGVGGGNWKISVIPYYAKYQPSVYRHWRNSHNDFLQVASEKGIPGFMAYLAFYICIIFLARRNLSRSEDKEQKVRSILFLATIAGFVVISLFSFPAERINHLIFIGLITALIIVQNMKNKPEIKVLKKQGTRMIGIIAMLMLIPCVYYGTVCISSGVNIIRAQKYLEEGRMREFALFAGKAWNPLIPSEPLHSFPPVTYMGTASYKKDHNYSEALHYFRMAYRQFPTHYAVLNNIASVFGEMGQYDSSIVYYEKSLQFFPHNDVALWNLAKAHFLKKEYEEGYACILSGNPYYTNQRVKKLQKELESKLNLVNGGRASE